MQNPNDMVTFERVVEASGFTKAACRMGASKSCVSKTIDMHPRDRAGSVVSRFETVGFDSLYLSTTDRVASIPTVDSEHLCGSPVGDQRHAIAQLVIPELLAERDASGGR